MSNKPLTHSSCRDNTRFMRCSSNDQEIVTTLVFCSCILIQVWLNGETKPYLGGKADKGVLDLCCQMNWVVFRNFFGKGTIKIKRCCNYANYNIISKLQSGSVMCCCVCGKTHLELDVFGKTKGICRVTFQCPKASCLASSCCSRRAGPECHISWAHWASWAPWGLLNGSWDSRVPCLCLVNLSLLSVRTDRQSWL